MQMLLFGAIRRCVRAGSKEGLVHNGSRMAVAHSTTRLVTVALSNGDNLCIWSFCMCPALIASVTHRQKRHSTKLHAKLPKSTIAGSIDFNLQSSVAKNLSLHSPGNLSLYSPGSTSTMTRVEEEKLVLANFLDSNSLDSASKLF